MDFVRTFPRAHLVAWALIIALSVLSTMTSKVEGHTTPPADPAPTADNMGPVGDLPSFCYAWRTKRATTHYYSGYAGFPHVYVTWQVRYNGCDVVREWVSCSAATTLVSVRIDWCGFYQPSYWNGDVIHVGANWAECTTPISGVGACYGNYVRQQIQRDGYLRWRWYYDHEPSGGWTWTSPW
jgi:hypothetical protein